MAEPTTAAGPHHAFKRGLDLAACICGDWHPIEFIEAEARQQDASGLDRTIAEIRVMLADLAATLDTPNPRLALTTGIETIDYHLVHIHHIALAALPPSAPPGLDVGRLRQMFDAQMTNPDAQWCSRDEITAILDDAAEHARLEQDR